LLMVSGMLMIPYRVYKYTFHVAGAVLLSSIAVLAFAGIRSYNLEFIAIGLLGVLAGFAPTSMIDNIGRHPFGLAIAYLGYLTAITIWNVPFLLLVLGVLLNLSIIYLVGSGGNERSALRNEAILLGKYSLLGYISQVAILQILSAGINRLNLGVATLPVSFAAAFVLTILSVEVVDRARARSGKVDRVYKAVFA